MPLQIIRQDITKMKVDAIVNTTNEEMIGYSGVDEAIHEAAGPLLDEECEKLRPLFPGEAKVTKGYDLDCKYIIHTSGPVWRGGNDNERELLENCYRESLKAAIEHGCETVAFPLISSGVYLFPKDKVLKIAVSVITDFLFEHELTVYLCVFDRTSYEFSQKLFSEIKEFIDDDYVEKHDEDCLQELAEFEASFACKEHIVCKESTTSESSVLPTSVQQCLAGEDKSLQDYMREMDKSFAYKLFDLIDASGMTDVECYKKANIDKKTFSKIKCNPKTYKPSKQTAVAFAIALRLNLDETQDLLASAGLTLSGSFTFDKIIRYFIQQGNYDVFEINEALFEFDQVLLGC